MNYQLAGKRALVSGSSSGIGRAIAIAFAAEGVSVVVHGRNAERAAAVVAGIEAQGGKAVAAIGDLSTDAGARAVVEVASEAFGGVDILVNNAGNAQPMGDMLTISPDLWVQSYQENVLSAVRLVQALAPGMQERGWGRIIQVASGTGSAPEANFGPYSSSKSAMIAFTVSLSKALTGSGVTVNTMSPGITATAAFERNLPVMARNLGWEETDPAAMTARAARELWPNPTGKIGSVDEQAAAVLFLASAQASYVNGANLRVDGGISGFVN
ncbi:MAG: SDR family NAD(P)-dependent oxidoreductase [Porticoccaceae bacterium]